MTIANGIYDSLMFKLVTLISIKEIPSKEKVIYLTFDDGPEPDITENVLSILNKHHAKATFFCTGENIKKYPDLVQLILANGHSIGNHTYSHLNGIHENYKKYIEDFNKCKVLIQTTLFRPPWGALSLKKLMRIRKENKIIMWSISSNDEKDNTNWDRQCQKMIKQTEPGRIVLFHFSQKHSNNTLQILPLYLEKLKGFKLNFRIID